MRILVSVIVAILCATTAMAAPFTNGNFESPVLPANGRVDNMVPDGWTTYANANGTPQMLRYDDGSVVIPWPVQYVQMQAKATNFLGGYQQTFDAVIGNTYTIQGWFRPLAGDVVTSVAVDTMGGTTRPSTWGAQLSGATSQLWQPFSFQVVAQATSMTIFLDVNSPRTGKAGAFDAICIPEPSGVLALLSGLPILGFAILRRK